MQTHESAVNINAISVISPKLSFLDLSDSSDGVSIEKSFFSRPSVDD
jgi:hypothetical protein